MSFRTYPVLVLLSLVLPLQAQEASQLNSNLSSAAYVRAIDVASLAARLRTLPARDRAVIQLYLKSAQGYVLTLEDGVYPDRGTEHWRNIAERAQ